MLRRHVHVIQRIGRTQFAPFTVERITIADKLSELVEYLHVFVVGPNLLLRDKVLERLRLTQLL